MRAKQKNSPQKNRGTRSIASTLMNFLCFDGYIDKEMTAEAYEENTRFREVLIRANRKRYYPILFFCLCFMLCLSALLMEYSAYRSSFHFHDTKYSFFAFYRYENLDVLIIWIALCLILFITLCTYFSSRERILLSKLEGYIYAYERFILRQNVEEDMYVSSIQMSYKYLDQYYRETREQATRGFRITVGVCVIGAAIVIIGVVLMVFKITTAAYITTASGVIIEFISSIFFHLYNKTIQSMGNYHNKLVLSQNIAIALKISDSIDGPDKNSVKVDMIKALTADINHHINSNKPTE